MSFDKTRRGRLAGAAIFAAWALFQACIALNAQINHSVIPFKTGWLTPEVGYFVALCLFAMAAVLFISAFRKSDGQKH
jgi:hypothetical protein